MWKRQASEAQKKVTQLKSAVKVKDARHLEEIKELRAVATNEHESMEMMVQTLEQQLQQQKDRTDKLMVDWPGCDNGWRHEC